MPRPIVTRVVEDYVTLVWKAYEWPGGRPTTTDLAEQLGVTPSTVSANLKKLAQDGYLDYEPYGDITLTERGNEIAVEIVRRHRIVEAYLVAALGLGWDEVHAEADRLEHAVSDLVLERMDAALGHPDRDPHGDPIPGAAIGRPGPSDPSGQTGEPGQSGVSGRSATPTADTSRPLPEVGTGLEVTVVRVSDRSSELLRFLAARGIGPGTRLQVLAVHRAAASMRVRLDGAEGELSLRAAAAIRVEAVEPETSLESVKPAETDQRNVGESAG